jgi:Spy/CpxP family protein refolding chaperone
MKGGDKYHKAHKMGKGGHHEGMGYFSGKLDLTDKQKAEMVEVVKESRKQAKIDSRNGSEEKGRGLDLIKSGIVVPGTNEFEAIINQAAEHSAERARNKMLRMGNLMTEVYNILTPDQQQKLLEMTSNHFDKSNRKHAEKPE